MILVRISACPRAMAQLPSIGWRKKTPELIFLAKP